MTAPSGWTSASNRRWWKGRRSCGCEAEQRLHHREHKGGTKMTQRRHNLCSSFVSTLWILCVFCGEGSAAAPVEQWDVAEIRLDGPAAGNPFTDVTLSARFTQGERSVEAAGFYDGDDVYRVRFMP